MPEASIKRRLKRYLKLIDPGTIITIVGFLAMFNFIAPNCVFAADKEGNGTGGAHEVVAELSDEQVRRLLIEELQKNRELLRRRGHQSYI